MLRIHCFSCQFACYRLLLEFPPTILKQYSVLNTAIFNLKHSSPDPTGKKTSQSSSRCAPIPFSKFLEPLFYFRHVGIRFSRTALGRVSLPANSEFTPVVWADCVKSLLISLHFPLSIQRMTNENNDSKYRLSNRPFLSSLVPLFQSESKCETILMKVTLICMKMKLHAELIFSLRLVLKQRRKRTRKWPTA